MKITIAATVIEGYSDKPSGRGMERWESDYDLPAVPRVGDYVETGYGEHPVEYVYWSRDGVSVILRTIHTLDDSMDYALSSLSPPQRGVRNPIAQPVGCDTVTG